jgi:hypothetical protein
MDWPIRRHEFEKLPFRDDLTGEDYVFDQCYRARAYPSLIFKFVGTRSHPNWWCFHIAFT